MGRSISVRKPLLVFGLLFFFVLGRFPAAAQDQKPMGSGIELTGRSDKDPPPQVWHVEDAKTKKTVASVDSRWGFTPLPPGQYRVSLLPVGWHPLEIPWGEVTVVAGKTATVNIDAGIELVGRSKEDQPLSQWEVFDLKTQKPVAHVEERWGFTPLPPGQYRVSLLPKGYHTLEIPWGEVTVVAGKTATVNIDARIELVGRSKEDQPLSQWEVFDLKTQKPVAHVEERWGFTPLPSGQYRVSLLPKGYHTLEISWGEVTVVAGKTATVNIDAGIELVGRSKEDQPLSQWEVFDLKTQKPVAHVEERWGFTPLPPGQYRVSLLPKGYHTLEIPWGEVTVVAGKTARVNIDAGIELAGRSKEDQPPSQWEAFDLKTQKPVAHVHERWGFTPLPPGQYRVSLLPKGYHTLDLPWGEVTVVAGKTATVNIDAGIELVGRSPEDRRPSRWEVFDLKTQKPVAHVEERWGFTPLPPGQYRVNLLPDGYHALEIPWSEVAVVAGKTARVNIDAGIELAGRSKEDQPLSQWEAFDVKTQKPVAHVYERWGFTPLPPGQYRVSLLPVGYHALELPWAEVAVVAGKTARVNIDAGIELAGRSKEDQPLSQWEAFDLKTQKPVAHVYERWGFTPLPPGQYRVSLLPVGYHALELPWGEVTVVAGKTSNVKIDAGIELVGQAKGDRRPDQWEVLDLKTQKPVAHVYERWGFTPLQPGEYAVSGGPGAFPWAEVKVAQGQVVAVRFPDVPERLARVMRVGRKTEKELDPVNYKKLEEEIEKAIRRGAAWLKKQDMFGKSPLDLRDVYPTIGILALLHAGEFERDSVLADRCLDYLLRRPLNISAGTYANALTAMALRDWDPARYRQRVFECAQWLVENQGWDQARPMWGYGDAVAGIGAEKKAGEEPAEGLRLEVVRRGLVTKPETYWDNSNSQFAVLGLHSAVHSGIKIPREVWERVEKHFHEKQIADVGTSGGWGYKTFGVNGSMTCAGLASLVVARHHLGLDKSAADPAVVKGLEWLAGHFTVEENPGYNSVSAPHDQYYYLYGLERVGVLAGTEFLGDHEWYPAGARCLLAHQAADGSWLSAKSPPTADDEGRKRYLDTCYAILFLRRATLSLTGMVPPRPAPMVEKPKPSILSVRYQGKGLPPVLVPAMELVLDCSGSMKDPVEGEPKYLVARRIMLQAVDELPEDFQVGLRVFGHMGFWGNNPGQPADDDPRWNTDSELKISIGSLVDAKNRRKLIKDWINYVKPAGATPLPA